MRLDSAVQRPPCRVTVSSSCHSNGPRHNIQRAPLRSSSPFMASERKVSAPAKIIDMDAGHTIRVGVSDEHGIYLAEAVLRKPLDCGLLEALPYIDDNGPVDAWVDDLSNLHAAEESTWRNGAR